MENQEQSIDISLEELIRKASDESQDLFKIYEPIEDEYRNATSFKESLTEVENTTTLARSYITTTISAR